MIYGIDAVLSIILLSAIYMKVIDFQNSHYDLYSYGLIPFRFTKVVFLFFLGVEGSLAVLFIFGKFTTVASIGLVILFTCFSLAHIYKRKKQGNISKCSCFGKLEWLNRMPLLRNVIFIVLAIIRIYLPDRYDALQFNLIFLISIMLLIQCMELIQVKFNNKGMSTIW